MKMHYEKETEFGAIRAQSNAGTITIGKFW